MAQCDENPETQLFSLSTMKHFATLLTLLRQKTHFAYIEWSQKITKTKKMIQLNQWNSSNFFYHLFNCYTVFIYFQSLLYKYLFMYSILTTGHLHVTWFHAISWLLATGNQLRELPKCQSFEGIFAMYKWTAKASQTIWHESTCQVSTSQKLATCSKLSEVVKRCIENYRNIKCFWSV